VRWDKLWIVLYEMGISLHLLTLIKNLYIKTTGSVRLNQIITNEFYPQRGVGQRCIFYPQLFNIYGEYIMRKALQNWEGGIAINVTKRNIVRYADDTVLLARDAEEIKTLVNLLEEESRNLGLELYISKTKIMVTDRQQNNRLELRRIDRFDVVDLYVYLGSLITKNDTIDWKYKDEKCPR
jgi:hypothetical protein